MKIKISKKTLFNLIKVCNSIIDNIISSPTIQGLYIEATTEKITFISTNSVISIKSELYANEELQIIEPGIILVKSKVFFSIIQKLKNEDILLEKVDNSVLKIKTKTFDSNINLLDEEQYPVINFDYENWQEIQISPTIFRNIQTKVIQSVSQNKEKINVLNGVSLSSKDKNIEIIGSDSYRLSYLLFKTQNSPDFKVVVDYSILKLLEEIVNHTENIKLYISENNLIIRFKNYTFASKVIEGNYPDVSNALRSPRTNKAVVYKRELLEALERGMTIAVSERKPVSKLTFKSNELIVSFKNSDLGTSEEKLELKEYSGNEISISLNALFLISLLKVIENEEVTIETSDENKPIFLTDPKEQNFVQLLLPVRNS